MSAPSLSHLLHSSATSEPNPPSIAHDPAQGVPSQGHSAPFNHRPLPPSPPPPPPVSVSLPPLHSSPNGPQVHGHTHAPVPVPAPASTPTNQSHSMNASLYQCADCKRRYSRPEHLARHIQTHTLGKRFACQLCGKAFARADLLKRHTANHENDGDSSKKRRRTDASPGAGRVSHACRPCAAARVKCEEAKPCTRCRNRNLTCEFASTEPGSTAAMHLVHFSASAHGNMNPPGPPSNISSASSPATYHDPGQSGQSGSSGTMHTMGDSPGNMSTAVIEPEQGQLPTPDAMVEQGNYDGHNQSYVANGAVDLTRLPFTDFLRDVLYDQDPSRLAGAQGLAVLDFCDDTNYELNEVDFGLLDHWNVDAMGDRAIVTQAPTPHTDESSVDMTEMRQKLVKIWTDSPWRWIPDNRDHGYGEHGNLPLPFRDSASQQFQESQKRMDRVVQDKLDPSSRDKALSVVLNTCRSDAIRTRVASSFPSAEVMDTLTHIFLASHLCSVSGWIHFGTFVLNAQWPEWLATAAAGGAVMTPIPTLRKFGFAVQEAVRLAIPSRFEENNTGIVDIGLVQTLVLVQDIGLWSGNRRKMEIAECHLLIPITMMRYRGRFQRSSYAAISVDEHDEGDVLEHKWKRWYEMESWKRLAFHCYLRDSQTSMTTLSTPTMSYAELTLPLPESKELWFARTALEWKRQFLPRSAGQSKRPPCLGDILRDINLLMTNHRRLDAQFTVSIYLHAFWNLIFEWRQLSAVHRSNTFLNNYQAGPNLILNSRHQELCKALSSFQLVTADWHASLSAQESLLLNLVLLNLHVCLDDLQLFAGKEGEDQARRVYPILRRWSESTEARQALWHAGQILRQAKMYPPGHLKDFYAVGVHHAALALWTYGVVTRATRNQPPANMPQEVVYVDGIESAEIQRFIEFGQGRPTIRGQRCENGQEIESGLEDPRACMIIVQEILRMNFGNGQDLLPPIVENLCHLINQLGGAAWAVGLG
ncbi:Uu.00g045850.m01.CDS01 [Anthostomella pinea]|uniref:Uu.00g045850.m01.CDS01 n=1 Tax=Anthostomella pinea TaxID=933095 RepID=A0AAI8VBX8_9PEZI|nr:Uu.00g045850.m01.CDS01 [Anthostomella pinea]